MKKSLKAIVSVFLAAASIAFALPLTASAADERQLGDVNGDGKVTVLDAFMVMRYSALFTDLSDEEKLYADIDGDGRVTLFDATSIQMKVAKSEENQPKLVVPESVTLSCGDRTDLDVKVTPESAGNGVTFEYVLDNAKTTDSTGEPVLKITNFGMIKAHHPGTSVVTVKASNGMTAKCTVTVVNETTTQTVNIGGNELNITKKLMTRNDCYNTEDDYNIQGIVVHSTATPGMMASQWYNSWNLSYEKGETDREVCVHAFLDDEGVYQYLPYEQVGWHVGGAANRTHIGFEICEPSGFYYSNNVIYGYNVSAQQEYFDKIWKNATVYCAYLSQQYNISVSDIISHKEANTLGVGTAHGDPDHWFILHGKTMDDFRADVSALLRNSSGITVSEAVSVPDLTIESSGATDNIYRSSEPAYDMFDVWGDNSFSLR